MILKKISDLHVYIDYLFCEMVILNIIISSLKIPN